MVQEYLVPSMSCEHCVHAISTSVQGVAGVQHVNVDLASKHVKVEALPQVKPDAVMDAIREAGYDDVVSAARA